VIFAMGASTNSSYAQQYKLPGTYSAIASWDLLKKATTVAEEKGIPYHVGNILTSDIFYTVDDEAGSKWIDMNILAVEMESYALYANAAYAGVNALTILTVSDSIVNKEETTPEEREKSFTQMMEIALELAE